MFGHSLGGPTAVHTMITDDRVGAALALDGHVIPDTPFGQGSGATPESVAESLKRVAKRVGDRPFMFMSSGGRGPNELGPLMTGFWPHLTGWRRFFSLTGSTHGSYTDSLVLTNGLADAGVIPAGLTSVVGTIDPARGLAAQRAYVSAFFDRWLRGRESPLLEAASAQHPEVVFFGAA
jgi:hypothetical protein